MAVTNAVIDLSHHNLSVNFGAIQGSGIFGVMHKATQGLNFIDPMYAARRGSALSAGLRWGAYHFGTGADGAGQAEFFLKHAHPAPGTLLVLDFERNSTGLTMTLDEARSFVEAVQSSTGRWPGLYGGSYLKEQLNGKADPVLGQCWLWLSQYGPTAVLPPGWSAWTLWQYTDGHVGSPPHGVPGVGSCDREMFQGAASDLANFWQ